MNTKQKGEILTFGVLCHPKWREIRDRIEQRFCHSEDFRVWAIDAVIAHQLGDKERSTGALKHLGKSAAADLRRICAEFGVRM